MHPVRSFKPQITLSFFGFGFAFLFSLIARPCSTWGEYGHVVWTGRFCRDRTDPCLRRSNRLGEPVGPDGHPSIEQTSDVYSSDDHCVWTGGQGRSETEPTGDWDQRVRPPSWALVLYLTHFRWQDQIRSHCASQESCYYHGGHVWRRFTRGCSSNGLLRLD